MPHGKSYSKAPLADLKVQVRAEKPFTSKECVKMYKDGTGKGCLQKVADSYMPIGGVQNPVPAKKWFDPSLYLDVAG